MVWLASALLAAQGVETSAEIITTILSESISVTVGFPFCSAFPLRSTVNGFLFGLDRAGYCEPKSKAAIYAWVQFHLLRHSSSEDEKALQAFVGC